MNEDAFDVQFTRNAAKDLRRFRQWPDQIDRALQSLSLSPLTGEQLTGSLDGVRSLHLSLRGSGEARIAYIAFEDLRICLVVAVGMRENFYDIVRRRVQSLNVDDLRDQQDADPTQ